MSHELLWMWSCCSYQQLLFCNLKIDCLSSERKTFSWYRLLTIQIRLNKYKFLRSCYCCCVSFVTTKKTNHPKPSGTTRNNLKPSATTRNHPQPPTQKYPQPPSPPATSSKLHEPVRNNSYPCKNTQILSKLPVKGVVRRHPEFLLKQS